MSNGKTPAQVCPCCLHFFDTETGELIESLKNERVAFCVDTDRCKACVESDKRAAWQG